MTPAARGRDAAFTLLEILSVVAIFALLAGIALPNFSGLQARNLDQQARRLVAQIELARQRAIVTGIPHRVFIDLEGAAYRVEWLGTGGGEEFGAAAYGSAAGGGAADPFDLDAPSLDLTAPREAELDYQPVPGISGRFTELEESFFFSGVETTGGWLERGETFIRFERDGSADATTIVIEHESGLAVTLEVLPLADTVRVQRESA